MPAVLRPTAATMLSMRAGHYGFLSSTIKAAMLNYLVPQGHACHFE
ncbi:MULTISPECIES: hypothetical protein [unclassified Ensifer]|nr:MULTISPECIES: hypothetical protein [unclassified Ensifer]